MKNLSEILEIQFPKDYLLAELHLAKDETIDEALFTKENMIKLLEQYQITSGIKTELINALTETPLEINFPVILAEGSPVVNGEDGYINYEYEIDTAVDRSQGYDFREVTKIPLVKKHELLATIISPTNGSDGIDVLGRTITAKPGRPARIRAGTNVNFNQEKQQFHAAVAGQVHFSERAITVHTIYELAEGISMKTGNVTFTGSVIVRGNVPNGFSIKATGNVTIHGMVEGATIIAGESIVISEGISGMQAGTLEAGENVHVGYVNQATVIAGKSIFVENSILNSRCEVVESINCQRGSIIGGTIYAGEGIDVNDLGNKIHTATEVSFGVNELIIAERESIQSEQDVLDASIDQFTVLMRTMEAKKDLDAKSRITLLKIKKSHQIATKKHITLGERLMSVNTIINNKDNVQLTIRGTMYPSTLLVFGKYKQNINRTYNDVIVTTERNEIKINPR